MAKGIVTIHVRPRKGHATILAMGKTPRDQSFIREIKPLAVKNIQDPEFKKELAVAIAEMLA